MTECIDPLFPSRHPPSLVDVVTGTIALTSAYVDQEKDIGKTEMIEFENSWPHNFLWATISKG